MEGVSLFLTLVIYWMSDVHGEVLHAAIGLPPTVEVTEARVAKLELKV